MEIKTVNMEIVKKKLSELKLNEENIRMHPDTQIREYMRSLKKNGQLKPFVIDEDGVIWIGNGLYQAMVKAGYEDGYCIIKTNMTRNEKIKMMMADNRIFDLGTDDLSVFDEFIAELDGDFDIPGYSDELLNSLIMDSNQVSDMLSEYGTIDKKDVDSIRSASVPTMPTTNSEEPVSNSSFTPNTACTADNNDSGTGREVTPDRKYVVCPKCGEKIWL